MDRRTQDELINTMSIRRAAWDNAVEMVVPVVEDHGLEPYNINTSPFVKGSTVTQVEQNLARRN
jgi:hypothetical protein